MAVDSKVQDLVGGLREEGRRLEVELSVAEGRVKALRDEVKKVQAGIEALTGKDGAGKKRARRASARKAAPEPAAAGPVPAVEPSPELDPAVHAC